MTTTETQTYEPCTTEVGHRRHLSEGLGVPYPGAEGREGDMLCGLHNGLNQPRFEEFWSGFGRGPLPRIEDLPLCGNCERLASNSTNNPSDPIT